MAGNLENRGKLRELIDKFQFVKQNNPYIAVEVSKGLRRLFLYPGGDEKYVCKAQKNEI